MTAPVFAMVNLGCRVNRVECDRIAEELEAAGYVLGPSSEADAVVVNTCAVTGEAEAKTRKALRRAAQLPQQPLVVATGCVANLFSESLAALAPNIRVIRSKRDVASEIISTLGGRTAGAPSRLSMPTATGRTRPGIKVQDGCDLRCTYCIVWKARGRSSSVPAAQVVEEVEAAIARNAREVVLTGINLGCYDDSGMRLPELLEMLLEKTSVGRLRISSIEPQDVDERLVSLMASSEGRIAPYLHMCLQSGSEQVLRRMGRVYSAEDFAERAEMAYRSVPNLAIETDLIVGFPGETDEEFEESRAFCERMRFSHIHTFRYSKRPGTKAAQMDGQVPPQVSAARGEAIRSLGDELRASCAESLVGSEDLVVTQETGSGISGGLFSCSLDQPVEPDELVRVRISAVGENVTLRAVVLR